MSESHREEKYFQPTDYLSLQLPHPDFGPNFSDSGDAHRYLLDSTEALLSVNE